MGLREKFGPRVAHAGVPALPAETRMKRRNFQAKNEELSNHRATSHFQIADQILPRSTRAAHGSTTTKPERVSRELLFSRKSCDVTPSEQPCSRPQLAARGPSRRRRSRHPAARKGAGDESRARRPPRASDACDRARDRRARTARAHLEIQIRIRWVTRLARLAARRGRMSSDGSTSRGSPHRARAWTTPRRRGRYANVPTLHPTRTRMYHESSRVRQTNNHD